MAFIYTGTLATDAEKVRNLIGDVVDLTGDTESLTEVEISWCLTEENSNLYRSAILAGDLLLARLRLKCSRTAAGLNSALREKVESLEKTIKRLQRRASLKGTKLAYGGGVSTSRNDATRADSDYAKPFATIGRDDMQGVGINDEDDLERS